MLAVKLSWDVDIGWGWAGCLHWDSPITSHIVELLISLFTGIWLDNIYSANIVHRIGLSVPLTGLGRRYGSGQFCKADLPFTCWRWNTIHGVIRCDVGVPLRWKQGLWGFQVKCRLLSCSLLPLLSRFDVRWDVRVACRPRYFGHDHISAAKAWPFSENFDIARVHIEHALVIV